MADFNFRAKMLNDISEMMGVNENTTLADLKLVTRWRSVIEQIAISQDVLTNTKPGKKWLAENNITILNSFGDYAIYTLYEVVVRQFYKQM
jgi:hypothetical protein